MELDKYRTVMDIVHKYQNAQKAIEQAYFMLEYAHKELSPVAKYVNVMTSGYSRSGENAARNIEEVNNSIKADIWKAILDKTHATEFMTPKRLETFRKTLEKPENLPDITPETIRDFVENVLNNAPDMLKEFIKETFDWLQPGNWQLKYKTNEKSKYEIKEKIIKSYVFRRKYSGVGVELRYRCRDQIQAMDNAFNLMDGKGTSKYPGNALTVIETACNDKKMECETDYFKLKFYLNGNCHIQFKRIDLVNQMNKIAGEFLVKPE